MEMQKHDMQIRLANGFGPLLEVPYSFTAYILTVSVVVLIYNICRLLGEAFIQLIWSPCIPCQNTEFWPKADVLGS